MFYRIAYENWHIIAPAIAFAVTLSIFGLFMTRALFMKKENADQRARLPLDDEDGSQD